MTVSTLLQRLFEEQKQSIQFFFDHLEIEKVEHVFQICKECKGLLIITGIGKSGIIAEKIAMTLISTGTKALFLSAANFLHGDIGIVGKEDVVLMLSKSGKTQELIELFPHLRKKAGHVIAVTSNQEGALAQMVENSVVLPIEKELCPFDLSPTISTTVQLLFGDVLAMALMREKKVSLEEYAANHPSGSIGRKTLHRVHDVMRTGKALPICFPQDRLVDVIVTLSNKRCGCLLVCAEDRKLLGIFTDGDLRRALQSGGTVVMNRCIEEFMTPSPIVVSPYELAYSALQKMQGDKFILMAPVIEKDKVVGLIHLHDIINKELEDGSF